MKHRFVVGELVTTSQSSFFRNRMAASCTVTQLLPKSAKGLSYLTQGDFDAPEEIAWENSLLPARTWEMP
jgi:hypothetical protein